MKDEHDNHTGELIPNPHHPVPQGRGGAVPSEPTARELRLLKLEMDRKYREREGLVTYLPVSMVAKEWRVSARRIRALLFAGRLGGRQQENGYWEVAYPYTITEGRRGPLLSRGRPKKPELRLV